MMIESGPSVRYASASQHPFGGRDRIGLARIDLDRDAQGPRQPLERRFGDVVVILAVERLDVERQPRGLRQAVEEMLEHLGIHLAESFLRERAFPHEIRPPRNRPEAHTSELPSLMRI